MSAVPSHSFDNARAMIDPLAELEPIYVFDTAGVETQKSFSP
jgi:hypothetical protein